MNLCYNDNRPAQNLQHQRPDVFVILDSIFILSFPLFSSILNFDRSRRDDKLLDKIQILNDTTNDNLKKAE